MFSYVEKVGNLVAESGFGNLKVTPLSRAIDGAVATIGTYTIDWDLHTNRVV
jgi:hypothetical protein